MVLLSVLTTIVLVLALVFKPLIFPFLKSFTYSPLDERIGKIPILSPEQLRESYTGKRVLIVGGTRGVGLGTAIAIAAAGGDVTISSRSEKSGEIALGKLRAAGGGGSHSFVKGDIGSVATANALVDEFEALVKAQTKPKGFDYLVVTAAVFPDWEESHQQEDGIDRCFAVAVVGRYIIYKNSRRFMNLGDDGSARVLNVLASGEMTHHELSHDLISGKRNASNFFDAIISFSSGNELMLQLIDSDPELHLHLTRVSTHPGMMITDLHRGQGLLMEIVEPIIYALEGISIEDSGIRQASILVSPRLPKNQLSFVSSDMVGRLPHKDLKTLVEKEGQWLSDLLKQLLG
jgi:hypothetical protein